MLDFILSFFAAICIFPQKAGLLQTQTAAPNIGAPGPTAFGPEADVRHRLAPRRSFGSCKTNRTARSPPLPRQHRISVDPQPPTRLRGLTLPSPRQMVYDSTMQIRLARLILPLCGFLVPLLAWAFGEPPIIPKARVRVSPVGGRVLSLWLQLLPLLSRHHIRRFQVDV